MNHKEVILVFCVVIVAFIFGLLIGNYYGLPFHDSGKKSDAAISSPRMQSNTPNSNTGSNSNRPR